MSIVTRYLCTGTVGGKTTVTSPNVCWADGERRMTKNEPSDKVVDTVKLVPFWHKLVGLSNLKEGLEVILG